jgi:hypothetical protein
MTKAGKHLIERMLQGYYMKKWKTHSTGADSFRLYDASGNPVETLPAKSINSITRFIDPQKNIFKTDKFHRITLVPSNILKLHGKNSIKVMYKKARQNKKDVNSVTTIIAE